MEHSDIMTGGSDVITMTGRGSFYGTRKYACNIVIGKGWDIRNGNSIVVKRQKYYIGSDFSSTL